MIRSTIKGQGKITYLYMLEEELQRIDKNKREINRKKSDKILLLLLDDKIGVVGTGANLFSIRNFAKTNWAFVNYTST